MSKEWIATVAGAEAAAQDKQNAEELAQDRFDAVREKALVEGSKQSVTETPEFREWMAARHATDAAWGAWAMAMDAKPVE